MPDAHNIGLQRLKSDLARHYY